MPRAVTEEESRRIRKLARDGKSLPVIAAETGRAEITVRRWLDRLGLFVEASCWWKLHDIDRTRTMALDGHTSHSIALVVGHSPRAVREMLREMGIHSVKTLDPVEISITLPRTTVDLIERHAKARQMSRNRFARMVLLLAARSDLFDAIVDDRRSLYAAMEQKGSNGHDRAQTRME